MQKVDTNQVGAAHQSLPATARNHNATWCARPGLQGGGVTLESINLPGSYLRHYDSQVWSANGTGGTWNRPQTLTADSTWNLATPWTP